MTLEDNRAYNLGYINGWLANMARVNDKTNHGFDFSLHHRKKGNSNLQDSLNEMFGHICERVELQKIENPKALITNTLLEHWLYQFQCTASHTPCLKDEGNNFSLSHNDWKAEWVEELVERLCDTTAPDHCFSVSIKEVKGFFACNWDEFIFEDEHNVYRLHLSVSD